MAHFAELNESNTVLRVIVISNDILLDENNNEQESNGIEYCKSLFGQDTRWIQTSYNANFRGKFAGERDIYDPVNDIFIEGSRQTIIVPEEENSDPELPTE